MEVADESDVEITSDTPARQAMVAELASLLEIDFSLARTALSHCQWNAELAVDAACELAANAAASSSGSSSSAALPNRQAMSAAASSGAAAAAAGASSAGSAAAAAAPAASAPASRFDASLEAALFEAEPGESVEAALFGEVDDLDGLPPLMDEDMADDPDPAPLLPPVLQRMQTGGSSSSSSQGPSQVAAGLSRSLSGLAADAPDVFLSASGPSAKKRRLNELVAAVQYKIPNSAEETPAPNPPMLRLPLREEQRRSLAWMIRQESSELMSEDGSTPARGGLLADRMGYGKTSTTIGLISLDKDRPLRKPGAGGLPLLAESGYLRSDSTLVMCPSHLVDQWLDEFVKFLGEDGVQVWQPRPRNYFKQNSKGFTVTVRYNGSRDLQVVPKPQSWTECGQSGALITKVGSALKSRMEEEAGASKALRKGDLITKVIIQQLVDHNNRTDSLSVGGNLYSLRRALKGEGLWKETRVGSTMDVNGRMCPRYETRHLRPGPLTTITFTVMRLTTEVARTSVVKGTGALKILVLKDAMDMGTLQQQDLLSAYHVVLASLAIQANQKYADWIKEASKKGGGLMAVKLRHLAKEIQTWSQDRESSLERSPALFEAVDWRRLVCDEFHESEAWEYRIREMLRSLASRHKWGLSGTPPLGNAAAVAEVAALLGYAKCRDDGNIMSEAIHHQASCRATSTRSKEWFENPEIQRGLNDAADYYVKTYIRQNTSALIEQIGIVEHAEIVVHTPEERIIYRQACHDHGAYNFADGYDQMTLDARAFLLKRCAHFDFFDMNVGAGDATQAVDSLGKRKREWLKSVEQQLWLEVARARAMGFWRPAAISGVETQHAEAKSFAARLAASTVEEVETQLATFAPLDAASPGKLKQSLALETKMLRQDGTAQMRPTVRLIQPLKDTEYYKDDRDRHLVVHTVARRAKDYEASNVLDQLAICEHACSGTTGLGAALFRGLAELVGLLDRAHRSLEFYEKQVNSIAAPDGSGEQDYHECSICLEDCSNPNTTAILPCSHVYHTACIRPCLEASPYCPECRLPVQKTQISSLVMELKPPEPTPAPAEAAPAVAMSRAWKQHGSKLNAIAHRLRQIRAEDPQAKALVFVQWHDLEANVAAALKDHEVPFVRLSQGSRAEMVARDGVVLKKFQEETDENAPYVLILSLQRAAAGTNLTSANHVLFVHPMNAETVSSAAAYERQALGRVRRIGQTRKEVHVWRYITKETVEEHICRLHRDAPAAET
eukprot:TRINITY_DN32616_c0_g1_i3.p1 TRINITY_DN32616_c0_g1~~TRINITY_DN32616_c0_g1_i3.p1  ORF type:complete len:1241 (+),score=264.55 TRINITY_DN32616_c0_g1_i3:81-3803(+)